MFNGKEYINSILKVKGKRATRDDLKLLYMELDSKNSDIAILKSEIVRRNKRVDDYLNLFNQLQHVKKASILSLQYGVHEEGFQQTLFNVQYTREEEIVQIELVYIRN